MGSTVENNAAERAVTESKAATVADESLATNRPHADRLRLGLVLGIALLLWLPRLNGPIDFRWDGGVYYLLGTSLATGNGYTLPSEPGRMLETQYPPLLPAVIALHERILGSSDPVTVGQALRITFMVVFLCFAGVSYLLARRFLKPNPACGAALVCIFSLHTYFMSDMCFPEILYGLVTVAFVLHGRGAAGWKRSTVTFLLAAAAYLLRTVGIVALVAWVGESLFRKNWRQAALRGFLAALPVIAWQGYIVSVEKSSLYANPAYAYQRADYLFYNVSYARNGRLKDPFTPELGPLTRQDAVQRIVDNVMMLPESLGESVTADREFWKGLWKGGRTALRKRLHLHVTATWPEKPTPVGLGLLVIAGAFWMLKKPEWLVRIVLVLSLAIQCMTPWPEQFSRYLVPVLPFLTTALFVALGRLKDLPGRGASQAFRPVLRCLPAAVCSLIGLVQLYVLVYTFGMRHTVVRYLDRQGRPISYRLFYYYDACRVFDAGLDWLRQRARPEDVVACSMPPWVYLRSGLKSVMPPFDPDPKHAQDLLDSVPVRYLFVDDGLAVNTRKYVIPVIEASPDKWRLIYSATIVTDKDEVLQNQFKIYERTVEGTSTALPARSARSKVRRSAPARNAAAAAHEIPRAAAQSIGNSAAAQRDSATPFTSRTLAGLHGP